MKKMDNHSGFIATRSNRLLVAVLTLLTVSLAIQAQDYARMTERTIIGTARYVGMGGAMTAIGGDPSAVHDNPAGLGLYRRMEVMLTLDNTLDYTRQEGTKNEGYNRLFMAPQASIVFSVPNNYVTGDEGIQFNNVMLSYHRRHTYNREQLAAMANDKSLGALLASYGIDMGVPYCQDAVCNMHGMSLKEVGAVNEFALDWAMNISNKWYVGLGIHTWAYNLSSNAKYDEVFDRVDLQGNPQWNANDTRLTFSGVGCSASAGLIYRPLSWLRMGIGLQTPTVGSLTTGVSGLFTAYTDSARYSSVPDSYSRDPKFHMPMHLSASLAFQVGAYGLLSLQYDYDHRDKLPAYHSLRAGIEVVPVLGMYINAGYAYESTFAQYSVVPMDPTFYRQDTYFQQPRWTQYASVAVGYRGTYMIVEAAYQYRLQRWYFSAHEDAMPYDMRADTHRIVLTLGWHHN